MAEVALHLALADLGDHMVLSLKPKTRSKETKIQRISELFERCMFERHHQSHFLVPPLEVQGK